MVKCRVLLALCCVALLTGAAWGYPIAGSYYDADEIVFLPVPPSPDFTNKTSGTIDASAAAGYNSENFLDYTIVVENKFDLINWKEILYDLTNIQVEADYWMDFHVDFSITNPAWEIDPDEPRFLCEAYWNITPPAGWVAPWHVVGFPGNKVPPAPVKLTPLQVAGADVTLDWMLPPYDGTRYYDWNPEWVSLEFYGYGFSLDYELTDWCVPEPATLSLLALGSLAFWRRRRS